MIEPTAPDPRKAHAGKCVAIMQPYFFPYAGYFRLLRDADEFVLYDCVQFPRRGRVNRTEISRLSDGAALWLTLPLARQRREVLIRDLEFAPAARSEFDRRLHAHPWIFETHTPAACALREHLQAPFETVIDFLEQGLRLVAALLGVETTIVRSSSLAIPDSLRGQERILAIAQARAARCYLNAPGGIELYDPAQFREEGIELKFLPSYQGRYFNLLPALFQSGPDSIRRELDTHP